MNNIPTSPLPEISKDGENYYTEEQMRSVTANYCSKLDERDKTIAKYYQEKNELQYKTQEMEKHIGCLRSDLAEAQKNAIDYGNPITVAQELIEKSAYRVNPLGQETKTYFYSKSELKQIAEHLLVYVNNTENRN